MLEARGIEDPNSEAQEAADTGREAVATGPEGRNAFDWSLLSPRRYSVQEMCLLFTSIGMLTAIVIYSTMHGTATLIIMTASTLTAMLTMTGIMIYAGSRTVGVEVWIRRMGSGDLDYRIEPRGQDEISQACVALETLRQSCIRAMELDLVRKLSGELLDRNVRLEQALEDLRRAQDRIVSQQKLAELGELSAGVAHEIRNPLQFIRNFAVASGETVLEIMELEDPEEVAELNRELADNMQRIMAHSDRINRIVSDMVSIGRKSSGEFEPTRVNRLLERHAPMACQSVQARDTGLSAIINWDLDPELGAIPAVPGDLARVFAHLVTNACHALSDKSRDDNPGYQPALTISTRLDDDLVTVIIRDNGVGMTPEVMEKIFNPFFTTRETGRGAGLGLSLCRDIVREHGGTIEAESEPGQGAELKILLPAAGHTR